MKEAAHSRVTLLPPQIFSFLKPIPTRVVCEGYHQYAEFVPHVRHKTPYKLVARRETIRVRVMIDIRHERRPGVDTCSEKSELSAHRLYCVNSRCVALLCLPCYERVAVRVRFDNL
jgi:hypothetical protein